MTCTRTMWLVLLARAVLKNPPGASCDSEAGEALPPQNMRSKLDCAKGKSLVEALVVRKLLLLVSKNQPKPPSVMSLAKCKHLASGQNHASLQEEALMSFAAGARSMSLL